MYEFFQTLGSWGVTVFVVNSMLNVGFTQKPLQLLAHLTNRVFLLGMLLLNLIVVPALMIAATEIVELDPASRRDCCCSPWRPRLRSSSSSLASPIRTSPWAAAFFWS